MVRFTFERLSDHRIAQALLEVEVAGTDPAPAFAQGGKLRDYVMGQYAYNLAGIAEAFAVQLPERYGIELLDLRSEEHTSELQSLMRISYAVFCLKKQKQ